MRLRTCNSRRKRLFYRHKEPQGKPFCYLVYVKRFTRPVTHTDDAGFSWTIDWEVVFREEKRPFDNYPEAIAHLTRVKLAIDEEDAQWKYTTPCKIVEGVYTKPGKEKITKVTRLNNECDRPPERHFSRGLPRQQRTIAPPIKRSTSVPAPKIVGNPYQSRASGGGYYTNPYVETGSVRGSGTTTSSSTATTVVGEWDEYYRLSY